MEEKLTAIFKLISGEELVAEYKTDTEFYLLKAPRKLVLVQTGPSEVKPRLMPWIIGNTNGVFPIHSGHVITVSPEMDEGLKTAYVSETSGIDLSAAAPKKIIGV